MAGKRRTKSAASAEWQAAEFAYTSLHASLLVPMFGEVDPIEALQDIVQDHPVFYPALLELGIRRLGHGQEEGAAEIERGLPLFFAHTDPPRSPKEEVEEAGRVLDPLESYMRYDLTQPFLEKLLERHPGEPSLHESLGLAAAMRGDRALALRASARAPELAPRDVDAWLGRAYTTLVLGEVAAGEDALKRAAKLEPTHPRVPHLRRIVSFLRKNKGATYVDYLLRPLELAEETALFAPPDAAEDEEGRAEDEAIGYVNENRLEAMGIERLRCGRAATWYPLAETLRAYFKGAQDTWAGDPALVFDDIGYFLGEVERVLNTFVIRHSDADEATLNEVCDALLELYAFLAAHDSVEKQDLSSFTRSLKTARPKVIKAAERYNRGRAKGLDADERAELVHKVFGNRHKMFLL